MPYVKEVLTANAAQHLTIEYSAAENDFMILIDSRQYGTVATPSGWTAITYNKNISGNGNSEMWYRRATAAEPTSVTTSHSVANLRHGLQLIICGGVDTTTAFDATVTSRASAAADRIQMTSITTTTDNCLILYVVVPHTRANAISPGAIKLLQSGTSISYEHIVSWYTMQSAAGASAAPLVILGTNTTINSVAVTIALRDDGNNYSRGYVDIANPPATPLHLMYNGGVTGHLTGTAKVDKTAVITDVQGYTPAYNSGAAGDTAHSDGFLNHGIGTGNPSTTSDILQSASKVVAAYDLTGAIISLTTNGDFELYDQLSLRAKGFAIGDGTNFRMWRIDAIDTVPSGKDGIIPVAIEIEGGFESQTDVGTFNPASIDHFVMQCYGGRTYKNNNYGFIYKLNTMTVLGGSTTYPVSMTTALSCAKTSSLRTVNAQGDQSATQFYILQKIQVGNGTVATRWDSNLHSMEWPAASNEITRRMQVQVSAAKFGIVWYASASCNFDMRSTYNMGNYHVWQIHASSSTSATYNEDGAIVISGTVTLQDIGRAFTGMTFIGCKEITRNSADLTGGNTISNCVDTQAITVTSEATFAKLANCTFTGNNRAIKITGNQAHTGAGWADPNLTVSGNTYDIEYTGATNFSIQSANTLSVLNSGAGTLTIVTPVTQLEVTSDVAASDIKIFNTGTQTIEASGTGTIVTTTTAGTYDITVMKVGYLPQRQTGVVLGATSVTVAIVLVADPVYNASHGLTWSATSSPTAGQVHWARVTRRGYLADNQQGRNVYSALIAFWISQSALDNTEFPISAVGPDRFEFTSDGTTAAQLDSGSVTYWKGAGMTWEHATTGNHTHRYCSVKSVGTLGGTVKVRYVQSEGGTINTATLVSGVVDQVVQYYSDTNGDGTPDYNYDGHLIFKSFAIDYYQVRNNVLASFGISTLEPYEYTIVLENVATGTVSGTQSFTPVVTNQQGAPVEEQTGYVYSFKVTEATNSKTPEQFLAQWLYDTYTDPTTANLYGSALRAFDLPCPIVESGGSYSSVFQFVENTEDTTEKHGFYFAESGTYHPDFLQQQEDQDAGSGFFVTPITAQISIINLPDDVGGNTRLHIYNVTTATVIYSGDPAGASYTDTYTDGDVAYATGGDSIRIRFAHMNAGTSFEYGQTIVLATTDGITADANNFVAADSVYALNAINGSTVTNFSADYVEDEIEIASDTDFTATQAYAFYCFALTDATGIVDFWGGVTATDVANYKINNATVNIYFNSPAGVTYTVKQTDAARIYRADDAYPVKDPTTSGYGVQVNWKNVVYVQNVGGSALTAGEQAQLTQAAQAATVNTKIGTPVSTVSSDIAWIAAKTDQLTFTKVNEVDINVKSVNGVTVNGTGTTGDEWGP